MANDERAKTSLGHGANMGISYNTCIRSTGDHLGIIPSKRAFRVERVRYDVEEVVVHGSSWEVVVHVATILEVVVLVTVVEVVVHGGGGSCSGSWRVVVHGSKSYTLRRCLGSSPFIVDVVELHETLSDSSGAYHSGTWRIQRL